MVEAERDGMSGKIAAANDKEKKKVGEKVVERLV